MKKGFLVYCVSMVLGILLILWSFENLFPIEDMEGRLVEESLCNWYTAPIIARLFIALNFTTGSFLIVNIKPRIFLPLVVLGIASMVAYDLAWEVLTTVDVITPGYSSLFGVDVTGSILIWGAVVLTTVLLVKFGKPSDLKVTWLKYPLGIVLFSLPFILNPVYPSDFSDQAAIIEDNTTSSALKGLPNSILTSDRALLTLYSTSCPHCLNAMKRLTISKRKSHDFIPVLIGFQGSEEGVLAFFKEAKAKFEYQILEKEQFLNLSGSSYPSFLLLENGQATKRWNGRTFNYFTLQQLTD